MRQWLVSLTCLVLLACGRSALYDADAGLEPPTSDTSRDAQVADSSVPDAGSPDAGTPDAGEADSGLPDAGPPEPGRDGGADGGLVDTGSPTCPIPADATASAVLDITADNRRTVWVNGVPSESTNNEWYQPTHLTITLRRHPSAENVIAVEATNLTSQAGFDRGLLVALRLNGAVRVSDSTWRYARAADGGWDAGDPAWRSPGFDDSRWSASIEQAANGSPPWGFVSGVSASARWLWSYFSNVPLKPNVETVLFRRSVYVTLDGGLADAPTPCP